MKKKIGFAIAITLVVLATSACKVHKGCPAYSQNNVELVEGQA